MKILRRCLSIALSAALIFSAVSGFALSASDLAAISQGELANYIVIGGAVIALLGAVLLLASFKKPKEKPDDDFWGDDVQDCSGTDGNNGKALPIDADGDEHTDDKALDDKSIDSNDSNDSIVADVSNDSIVADVADIADDADSTEGSDVSESSEDSNDSAQDDDTVQDGTDDGNNADRHELAEDIIANQPPVEKVRLTLGGMNSDDVRIVEFSDKATIGRRNTNNVVISDNAVSGEHCRLIYSNGVVTVEDTDSTNGTVVNGKKISACEIKNGDVIILGKTKYRISFSIINE